MKHTVIVSSYNRPTMIVDCLESILNQTYQDFEVLIMDDGSNADTLEAIVKYVNDDRFRYFDFSKIHIPDVWRYTIGINTALKYITGDVIHYLPDDDIFDIRRFENVNKFMWQTHFDVGYGALINFNDRETEGLFKDITNIEHTRFPTFDISPENLHPFTGLLDHGQVFHSVKCYEKVKQWRWVSRCSDSYFFHDLSRHYKFHPMPLLISAKRNHSKYLMKLQNHDKELKE